MNRSHAAGYRPQIAAPVVCRRAAAVGRVTRAAHRCGRSAITLMEVLVVVSIIGMLMALLLPAVQASRESARRNTCENHVKQLSLAALNHEAAFGRFPSGGWGFGWVGDPDRGTGPSQPGGWAFDLLPYLERTDLARIGAGLSEPKKKAAVTAVLSVPLDVFNCPTRRALQVSAFDPNVQPANFNIPPGIAESDYAINAGDFILKPTYGPKSYADADKPSYQWPDNSKCTGICYLRSEVKIAQIADGTGHTYLIGEKYAVAGGWDPGDDQGMYSGYDYDTYRWTKLPLSPDRRQPWINRFGSAHPTTCQFAFCDGSVRPISFDIDASVHRLLGNRKDGTPIDDATIE
ncbi:MAG TPA: DUF1559 domain-containing protein [Pirellulales bacterium]|nr:DUF1559 domain-containing protein [Pirellulales bacterium]